MSQPCASCIDAAREKSRSMDELRQTAKTKAIEKGQAQAICQEDADGSIFTADAATAFRERFHILQVVSGLSD